MCNRGSESGEEGAQVVDQAGVRENDAAGGGRGFAKLWQRPLKYSPGRREVPRSSRLQPGEDWSGNNKDRLFSSRLGVQGMQRLSEFQRQP